MNGFVLHLQGPMMSYADRGFGQLREEGEFPSRSAVLGVIGAAMGLERGDPMLLTLHRGLRVHAAQAQRGSLLVDYHTVLTAGYDEFDEVRLRREGVPGKNPTLTWRSYHCDAHYVAVVEGDDAELVERCRAGLRDPHYTAYLGRRSCPPATPLLPKDGEWDSPLEALDYAVRHGHRERNDWKSRYRRGPLASYRVWLDGEFRVEELEGQVGREGAVITATSHGYRRDLLTAVPRTYVTRPVTHLRIALPPEEAESVTPGEPTTPMTPTTNQEYYDAAP